MLQVRLLVVPLAVLSLAVGCGGSGDEPAEATARSATPDAMLKRVLAQHFSGAYRLAYDSLHPRDQALVTRDNYAYCLKRVLTTIRLGRVRTLGIVDAPLRRSGIPENTAKQVKLRITAIDGKMRDSWEQTFQAVRVDGRWAWILPDEDVREYRAGRCPAG